MMNEELAGLTHLVQDVFATRDDEIQCDKAGILIARCTDALLSDDESEQQYPGLWHHFRFCPNCYEEYIVAMDLARLEAKGQHDRPVHIPPLPDGGGSVVWRRVKDAITSFFPGFPAPVVEAVARGRDDLPVVEPVEVSLRSGELRIAFDLAIHEQNPKLRDLFCTVMVANEELEMALEGASVCLQIGDDGPAVQEGVLNEVGDVGFFHLSSGRYTLRLHLVGQEYAVTGIVLP